MTISNLNDYQMNEWIQRKKTPTNEEELIAKTSD